MFSTPSARRVKQDVIIPSHPLLHTYTYLPTHMRGIPPGPRVYASSSSPHNMIYDGIWKTRSCYFALCFYKIYYAYMLQIEELYIHIFQHKHTYIHNVYDIINCVSCLRAFGGDGGGRAILERIWKTHEKKQKIDLVWTRRWRNVFSYLWIPFTCSPRAARPAPSAHMFSSKCKLLSEIILFVVKSVFVIYEYLWVCCVL